MSSFLPIETNINLFSQNKSAGWLYGGEENLFRTPLAPQTGPPSTQTENIYMTIDYRYTMVTTIQMHEKTLGLLKQLKAKLGTTSYEDTILALIKRQERIPESMFGAHPELGSFKRGEEDFHEP